jgi:Uma2 family endonuclease
MSPFVIRELPKMSAVPKPRLLTEEEYLLVERRAELKSEYYRGEMFQMAGAKRAHNLITGNLVRVIGNEFQDKSCEVYSSDMRVKASSDFYTYPYVVAVCGGPRFLDDELDTLLNPLVIIEVLSESTQKYDESFKVPEYRRLPSLKELALVNQEMPYIEIYQRERGTPWKMSTITGLDATLSLKSIGCKIPLAEVYAKVKFPRGWEKALAVAIQS